MPRTRRSARSRPKREGRIRRKTPILDEPAPGPLSADLLAGMDAYWRASNYLAVGQIYLFDNPLLEKPLRREHVKPRLLGHWGTTPGLNFIYVHLNRVIRERDLDMIYVIGPGHGGPAAGGAGLPRGHLQRGLPADQPGRGRDAAALQAVQLPRRHPEPRRARDAGLDPRGRRARLRPVARLRRGLRQPRSHRRRGRGRRRSRDRSARHQLALQQVPEPGAGRLRAAHPAPQRLQDRQPLASWPAFPRTSCRSSSRATATGRTSSRGTSRMAVHQQMAAVLDEAVAEIAADPGRGARARRLGGGPRGR